jgi:hypothetical protein
MSASFWQTGSVHGLGDLLLPGAPVNRAPEERPAGPPQVVEVAKGDQVPGVFSLSELLLGETDRVAPEVQQEERPVQPGDGPADLIGQAVPLE